ncbi:MAG: N-acetyltransferase family protein [Opitutales bacterium]
MMTVNTAIEGLTLRAAEAGDAGTVLRFIEALGAYEKLSHEVVATEDGLRSTLFGEKPAAEVVLAEWRGEPVGFALFFITYSTFLAKPGLYLEDLFVLPEARDRGIGKTLLRYLARLAVERDYGRFEWSVLDWNEPALRVYRAVGAQPMEGWTVQRVSGKALAALAREFTDGRDGGER